MLFFFPDFFDKYAIGIRGIPALSRERRVPARQKKFCPTGPIRITFFGRCGWVFFDKTVNDFCSNGVTLYKKVPTYYFL